MKILVAACALALAGCTPYAKTKEQQSKPKEVTSRFEAFCIDGIQYWYGHGGSTNYSIVMAPRYDPKTGYIVRCDSTLNENSN